MLFPPDVVIRVALMNDTEVTNDENNRLEYRDGAIYHYSLNTKTYKVYYRNFIKFVEYSYSNPQI